MNWPTTVLDLIGNTPLVELTRLSPQPGVRLFAKLEGQNPSGSIKDRIAKSIVERAEAEGALRPGMTILEASTGNTGISLALVGRIKGYRVKVVVPQNVVAEVRELLALYGAEVIWSDPAHGTKGAIELAQAMAQKDPLCFLANQFASAANVAAHYETTGPEILAALPQVDVLVAGLGTGGTITGVGRRLREHNPGVKLVAVEPYPGVQLQGLKSLQDGFIPPILDLSMLDAKFLVRSPQAFTWTRILTEREGIFAGLSSGAVITGAMRWAERMESGNLVLIFADGGWKYLSTHLWTRPATREESEELEETIWW